MRLKLDFHYSISCIPYRCQNSRSAWAAASTEVDIREISAAEAPVALLVGNGPQNADDRNARRYALKADGSPRAVRFFEGRHWIEAGTAAELAALAETNLNATFFGRGQPRNAAIDGGAEGANGTHLKLTTLQDFVREQQRYHPGPVAKTSDDGGRYMADKLDKLAGHMIIVDGIVYEYTPEPILRMKNEFGDKACIVPRPPVREGFQYGGFDFHGFEYGTAIRSSLKHVDTVKRLAGRGRLPFFEVIDPMASTFDGATYDFSDAAGKLYGAISSKPSALPWNVLEAFYELRDAREDAQERVTPRLVSAVAAFAALEEPDPAETAAIAGRAERMRKTAWGHSRDISEDRREFLVSGKMASLREMAEAALSRWEARPRDAYWENGVGHVSSLKAGGWRTAEMLSEGTAVDAARACQADPRAVLEAAARGDVIVAASLHISSWSGIASVSQDGVVTMMAGSREAEAAITEHAAARRRMSPAPEQGGAISLERGF